MSKQDGSPIPGPDTAAQAAALSEVQLTLAQAQRAMAEALLALSSGVAPGAQRQATGASSPSRFPHTGSLQLCDGELRFIESDGPGELLEDLADRGKTIRLEFDLSYVGGGGRSADDTALFNALSDFLSRRALALIPMEAQCDDDRKPDSRPKPPPDPAPPPTQPPQGTPPPPSPVPG
jgi:hypothetical protein